MKWKKEEINILSVDTTTRQSKILDFAFLRTIILKPLIMLPFFSETRAVDDGEGEDCCEKAVLEAVENILNSGDPMPTFLKRKKVETEIHCCVPAAHIGVIMSTTLIRFFTKKFNLFPPRLEMFPDINGVSCETCPPMPLFGDIESSTGTYPFYNDNLEEEGNATRDVVQSLGEKWVHHYIHDPNVTGIRIFSYKPLEVENVCPTD